jgi:hypothetical protein
MELFVLRSEFTEGESFVRSVVAYQLGIDLGATTATEARS